MANEYAIGEPVRFDGCKHIGRIVKCFDEGANIQYAGGVTYRKFDAIYPLHDYDDGPVVNTKQLDGMFCPKCGDLGPFDIHAKCTVTMSDDGPLGAEDFVIHPDASCKCRSCGFKAILLYFKVT